MSDAVFQDYTIYQAKPQDWAEFRAIRLEALRLHSAMLAGSMADEENRTEEEWKKIITTPGRIHFLIKHDNDIVGQFGILVIDRIPNTAILVGGYVHKKHRGKGLTDKAIEISESWARENGFPRTRAYHREDNKIIRNILLKRGYVLVGQEDMTWSDGKMMPQYFYEKNL